MLATVASRNLTKNSPRNREPLGGNCGKSPRLFYWVRGGQKFFLTHLEFSNKLNSMVELFYYDNFMWALME